MNNQGFQDSTQGTNGWSDSNAVQPTKPNNNLVLSIVATVLGLCSPCCIGLILGIIAIVFSTQTDSKYTAGDYAGAEKNSKNAKILAFIAIGLFVLNLLYSIFLVATGRFEDMMNQYQSILESIQ